MAELDSTELHIRDTPQYFFDTGMIEEIQNIDLPPAFVPRPMLVGA